MRNFGLGLAAVGLFVAFAPAAFPARAADEPAAAKSKDSSEPAAAKSKNSSESAADEASPSREGQDKAKKRKTATKAVAKTEEKKASEKRPADRDVKKNGRKADKKPEEKPHSSPEAQESAALALVAANHPELLDLLEKLKADNAKQYRQAIQELYRASQRLADRKEKDPARYELELKAWKLDSQARLMAAKLTMDSDPELQDRLKAVLAEREDVAIAILAMDRDRLADRLQQIERQLGKRREQRDARARQAFEQLTRGAGKPRAKGPAAKEAQAAAKGAKQDKIKQRRTDAKENEAERNQAREDSASEASSVIKP